VALDLNNLAVLFRNTNRQAEAEPLSRRHLQIFAEFGRRTGYLHPHFHAAINNYAAGLRVAFFTGGAAARAVSASVANPAASFTAISASTLRSSVTPAAFNP